MCVVAGNNKMLKIIATFVFGFSCSWLVSSSIYYYRSRPLNFKTLFSGEEISLMTKIAPWVVDGIAGTFGNIYLVRSKTSTNDKIISSTSNSFPFLVVSSTQDNNIKTFSAVDIDKKIASVVDSDTDGSFDALSLTLNDGNEIYTLIDKNFDGIFDIKIYKGVAFINDHGNWILQGDL